MINIIVAVNNKGYIGKNNRLMWHNSEDLKLFKSMTEGKTLVMGRKTWESLPVKPLKNRYSIIVSKELDIRGENFHCISCLDVQAMAESGETYWVIGGEDIYKQFLPFAKFVHISKIDDNQEGDVKFPLDVIKERFTCRIIRYGKTFKQYMYESK